MYRITWFCQKEYSSDVVLKGETPREWITKDRIEKIGVSAWEEHCLECAPPECYGNCERYIKRCDQKCKKTSYGIKRRRDLEKNYPSPVQLKFLPWGKIETYKFDDFYSLEKITSINKKWYVIDRFSRGISNALKFVNKKMSLCGLAEVTKNKKYNKAISFQTDKQFLFQVYSNCESNYTLFLEFLSDDKVFFRKPFSIKQGYNQLLIDCGSLKETYSNILIRYYPENDFEAEIVVLFSDFIVLKKESDKKVKCVAWDLDNTIWDGILIESNPNNLKMRDGVFEVIKQLDERGIIQIVISKNDEHDVIPVLKRLGIFDYFVYVVANWELKSANIRNVANALNINVNSFAFIDDSPFERGEVKNHIPEIRVYDEKNITHLLTLDEFNVLVTNDSKMRRRMYQIEAERNALKNSYSGDEKEFLKDCQILLTIEEVNDSNVNRCFELVQRTNQLNLSGIKYTQEEFAALLQSDNKNSMVLFCEDRFGTYGQIGFIMYEIENKTINIKEYAMSCRVAGKWLEPAILTFLKEKFSVSKVCFFGKNNQKNERLFRTLTDFGLHKETENGNITLWIDSENINYPRIVTIKDKLL